MAHLNIDFLSNTLARVVNIKLILPSKTAWTCDREFNAESSTFYQDKINMKYPLLILLHGYLNDSSSWLQYTRAEMFAEENNIAICTMNAENKFYVNNPYDKFYDFIEFELRDYLYGNFNISNKREDNYIAGLSMGGFGTLIHGLKNPEHYKKIGAFSPKIYMEFPGILNGNEIEEAANRNKDNLPEIYISVGEKDGLKEEVKKFDKFLSENGIKHETCVVPEYDHEWRFWDKEIEKFILGLDRTDEAFKHAPHGV